MAQIHTLEVIEHTKLPSFCYEYSRVPQTAP